MRCREQYDEAVKISVTTALVRYPREKEGIPIHGHRGTLVHLLVVVPGLMIVDLVSHAFTLFPRSEYRASEVQFARPLANGDMQHFPVLFRCLRENDTSLLAHYDEDNKSHKEKSELCACRILSSLASQ